MTFPNRDVEGHRVSRELSPNSTHSHQVILAFSLQEARPAPPTPNPQNVLASFCKPQMQQKHFERLNPVQFRFGLAQKRHTQVQVHPDDYLRRSCKTTGEERRKAAILVS